MPATSERQARLFRCVEAYKKHKFYTKSKSLHTKVKNIARGISIDDAHHFTTTQSATKLAFMVGFLKQAHLYGFTKDQTAQYVKKAGLDKTGFVEFIPAAVRILASLGGSVAGQYGAEAIAARAAAGKLPKMIQNSFIGKSLKSMTPTASKPIGVGEHFSSENTNPTILSSLPSGVGMMGGGYAGDAIAGAMLPEPKPLNEPSTDPYNNYEPTY